MENKIKDDIVLSETYKITYLDKLFAGVYGIKYDVDDVLEIRNLPENIALNDLIHKYYNRTARKYFYTLEKQGGNIKLSKDLYKDADFSEWVVFCLYKHTVCLYNLYNFSEKRYVADSLLELNSEIGDIYFCTKKDGAEKYIFDSKRNFLASYYASYFGELNTQEIKNNRQSVTQLEKEGMKAVDKENTELFNKNFNQKFIKSFFVYEAENLDGEGYQVYSLRSEDDKVIYESAKNLPKYAREGDCVGLTTTGEYKFNRNFQIQAMEEAEKMSARSKGKKYE